jgi:hypothetical protein
MIWFSKKTHGGSEDARPKIDTKKGNSRNHAIWKDGVWICILVGYLFGLLGIRSCKIQIEEKCALERDTPNMAGRGSKPKSSLQYGEFEFVLQSFVVLHQFPNSLGA